MAGCSGAAFGHPRACAAREAVRCYDIANSPSVIIYAPSPPAPVVSFGCYFSNAFISGHLITGRKNEPFRNTDIRMQNMQGAISAANERGRCGSSRNRKNTATSQRT